jgi:hypothetical protein
MEKSTEQVNPGHTPIRITDAASMLRKVIDVNERPFAKTVMKMNNEMVDEWAEKVLRQICDTDGCIKSAQMWYEWQYFYMGKIVPKFVAHLKKGLVSRPSNDAVKFWVDTFASYSVKRLLSEFGAPLVGHGWKLLIDEAFIRDCEQKWELVYQHSNDPLAWRKLANDNPTLWNENKRNAFWDNKQFEEISQKVVTVLSINIKPDN